MSLVDPTAIETATDGPVVALGEWQSSKETYSLSDRDLRTLNSEINADRTRVGVEFNADGKARFSARQFVGVVGLPDGPTIQIEPKAAGSNLLYMLRYGQGVRATTIEQDTTLQTGESFVDALAALYLRELREIIRRGIHSEYQRHQATEQRLRGQLDVQRQLQRQGPIPTEFECEYDHLTADTVTNQAILYGAAVLIRLVHDDDLRRKLEWHTAQLRKDVTLRPVRPAELDRIEVTRLNEYYADILRLVEPILRQSYVENIQIGQRQSFSLLVNMNRVFEAVVERAIEAVAERRHLDAEGQARTRTLLHGKPTVTMYPDFVVSSSGQACLVGDAKWKTGTVRNSDLYQIVSYSLAHEAPGVLLYPAQQRNAERHYVIDGGSHIEVHELPTNADVNNYEEFVKAIESSLNEIVTGFR